MKTLDHFPLYVYRILLSQDVILMSTCEFGAYVKLLFVSFVQNPQCYIKNDDRVICELCKFKENEWQSVKAAVLKKFSETTDGMLYNEVLLEIYREELRKQKGNRKENLKEIGATLKYPWTQFWDDYDKKVGSADRLIPKWLKLTDEEREKIRKYIPFYKHAQPDKKYRKNPETFLNQRGWEHEIIYSTPDAVRKITYNEQGQDPI